jgi:signal transduction histidine kinase
LEEQNTQLQEQASELEFQQEQLQLQAVELEMQKEEIQTSSEELALRTEAAETANRAKSDFLATMSHELRTPLNAIAGYADLMELGVRGEISNDQRDDLRRIKRSQRHLLSLVNDILNFARLETGRVDIAMSDVDVEDVLAEAETLVAPQLRARGLQLEHKKPDPPLRVHADRDKLQQILVNLLNNACKYTTPGGRVRAVERGRRRDGEDLRRGYWPWNSRREAEGDLRAVRAGGSAPNAGWRSGDWAGARHFARAGESDERRPDGGE